MKYDWVKELPYTNFFPSEFIEIIEVVGIDKFLILLEKFGKTNVYFSLASISSLQEEYVKKNKHLRAADLARKLDASERNVYNILKDEKDPDQFDLYE